MPEQPKRPAAGTTLPPHRGPGATPTTDTPVDSGPEVNAGASGAVTTKMPVPDREEDRGIHLEILDRARYDIDGEFARGGLGRILRARDKRLDRTVALKELHFRHPAAEARFRREVAVTARLQHPNIIAVHDAGYWPEGEVFFAMKLVDGRSLAAEIRSRPTFVERLDLVPAVLQAAEAMAYAHSEGIIHRDLKPANVLIGPFGETVVIDWGLAKDLGDATDVDDVPVPEPIPVPERKRGPGYETTDGAVVGTPAYMPPEQARGDAVDATADVYALGAMLYHVLCGQLPFADHSSAGNLIDHVKKEAPTPLRELEPEVPPDLAAIVERAMAREPQARYPTAKELAEELRAYTTGRLVGTYHYSGLDLIRRFVRKQRPAVATGVLALLALFAFGALSVQRITAERDRAERSAVAEKSARELAERSLNEARLNGASAQIESDPSLAIELLRRVRGTPALAASLAARAEGAGIAEKIFRGHRDQVATIGVDATGERVVSGGVDHQVILWGKDARLLGVHDDRVTAALFSPDGTSVASAGYDGSVHLWDTRGAGSRALRKAGARGEEPAVPVMALAFAADGSRLAALDQHGRLYVWDDLGAPPRELEVPHDLRERDYFLHFADRDTLISGSHAGQLRVTDLATGRGRFLTGHSGPIHTAAVAPDGTAVATGGADGTVRIWSLATGRARVLRGHGGAVFSIAYAGDGRTIASAGDDEQVRLWNPSTGELITLLQGQREGVLELAFTRDARYLAAAGWDGTVIVHDLVHHTTHHLRGHGSRISMLRFSGDDRRLVSASWDRTVRVWRLDRVDPDQRQTLRGHREGVKTVAFSPDGHMAASGAHDDTVRLWDVGAGTSKVLTTHADHVYRVVFSPDGSRVASSSDDRTVRVTPVVDGPTGGPTQVLTGHTADVEELSFSSDGTMLASAAEDNTARVWTLATGAARVLRHDAAVTDVAFSPSGDRLVTSSRDGGVYLWSGTSGERLSAMVDHGAEVRDLAFSPDGRHVVSADAAGMVILWTFERHGRTLVTRIGGAGRVEFASDSSHVAVAGHQNTVWVCDVHAVHCTALVGHRDHVNDLAFSPDGTLLITGGHDRIVRVWDLATGEHRPLEGHTRPIFDVEVSADGERVISASADTTVRVWSLRPPPARTSLHDTLAELSPRIIELRPRR